VERRNGYNLILELLLASKYKYDYLFYNHRDKLTPRYSIDKSDYFNEFEASS